MPSASDVARISSAAQSDVGRTRSENQDAFGEFSTPSGERLFIVADGMGGHRGGATASRLCVETLGRAFTDGGDAAEARLRRGFELANARIHEAAQSDPELGGMGTTAVALVLSPDGSAALGWVGDSRAYRFSQGALERLSTDHSVVGEMIRAGVLTEAEADNHPRRNELLRAIGPHEFVEPETLALRHNPGDRFLLCSDGLWGPVPEAELAIVLGFETPELAVKKLIAKANERGGPDNVTAQIASVSDPAVALAVVAPSVAAAAEPRARSRTLPLLASCAAVATAALIALAVYELPQSGSTESAVPPPAMAAPPAPVVAAGEVPAPEAKPPIAPKQEAPKSAPKPAVAPAPTNVASKAKVAPPKATAQKPVIATPPSPKPAKPPASKPAESQTAAASPPAPESAPQALSRVEVEQFLLDWETAIASKDFALYSRLGLPGDEQTFNSYYGANSVKIDFSLRDFGPSDPDESVVRVQMVLETQEPSGTKRAEEEQRFIVKQTPQGLRYVGLPKN